MAYYTCSIGSHTFEALPEIDIETTEVVRTNVTPNRLVARNYTWSLQGRIRAATPSDVATSLLAFLTAAVNPASGTIPTSFKILNASSAAIAQIGDVRTGTSEEWEDLRVTTFRLLPESATPAPGLPLVADVQFEVGFSARRSFPDANGICELVQEYRDEPDEFGNTVRNLTTTEIRLAKSSANTIASTEAIRAQLRVTLPVGWRRTKGDTTRGFTIRYLDYPLLHRAYCESEVTRSVAGANTPAGTVSSKTSTRIVDDPEKGVRRYFYEAENVGSTSGLTWVEDQRDPDAFGETESRPEERTYRGKWQRLEPLRAYARGRVTRERRVFSASGGVRSGGAIRLGGPYLPAVSRGATSEIRLTESVRVYALGPTTYEDVPLPDPLPAPWLLVEPCVPTEPTVDEDSNYPAQRLWARAATRDYLWGGAADDPRASAEFVAAVFADAAVSF